MSRIRRKKKKLEGKLGRKKIGRLEVWNDREWESFRGGVIGGSRQFNHRALAELPPQPEASPTFTLGFRVVRFVRPPLSALFHPHLFYNGARDTRRRLSQATLRPRFRLPASDQSPAIVTVECPHFQEISLCYYF